MKGKLILQDGSVFHGNLLGDTNELKVGEVVFNTSMTGYQEVLTDPSYYGQVVVMTYPLIGNYGVNFLKNQSDSVKVKGLVVRELSKFSEGWDSEITLNEFLKMNKIVVLEGVDTRQITKLIRDKTTMNGMITKDYENEEDLFEIKSYLNEKPVYKVTTKENYIIKGDIENGKKIAVIDFGIKENILNNLKLRVKELKVFKANFTPDEIKEYNPDGLFLSNGPGDPEELVEIIENLKMVIEDYSTFGICLGHQLIALIYGLKTKKMKFGHRGGNHPVISKKNNKVFISAQNHGYEVFGENENVKITYENVNDKSVEGIEIIDKSIFSVQFHPEASPGPQDTLFLFDEFINELEVSK
ncbi:carbamoyl phosphate synthase small subunit [Clostridiaceae bacterium HSG29]|nr:carbamoyl phosphate synthase small subunit [Clostridiaceae bacterium HSG29]